MLSYYIEACFYYFGTMLSAQYLIIFLAGKESRNCLGRAKGNKLLWLLPKEMHYVTLLTQSVLVGTEIFFAAGAILLVTGDVPWILFLGETFFCIFCYIYLMIRLAWINKKIKEKPWKRLMEGKECDTKPLKVRMYGSGFKEFTYGIIIKACLICVMNIVWLLRDQSPFIPFISFLEWLLITGLEAYLGIRLWMEEKGFRRVITVEGGQAVYKNSKGKCRRFPISDLYWMDTPNGIIRVLYKKEEEIDVYIIYAHGVKEVCSIVEEVEWKEPED